MIGQTKADTVRGTCQFGQAGHATAQAKKKVIQHGGLKTDTMRGDVSLAQHGGPMRNNERNRMVKCCSGSLRTVERDQQLGLKQ